MPEQEESQTESQPCLKSPVDTHIDENGVRQPNPPRVNMLKLVNHIEANRARNT